MPVGALGCHPPARRALQEAFLDQERLVDVLERAAILADRRRDRLDPGGPALVVLDQRGQDLAVDLVEAELVDLERILVRSARILDVPLDPAGASEIARRSRGTPRIANRLLRRVRDYAQVRADGRVTREVARDALRLLDVDEAGFDKMDRALLLAIIDKFAGGPVGLDTLAAAIGEERDTIEDVYEPFLIQEGFLARTPRGRVATALAYRHFGRPQGTPAAPAQGRLL